MTAFAERTNKWADFFEKNPQVVAAVWVAIGVVAFTALVKHYVFSPPKDKNGVPYRLPPGPPGLPIFGNAFQIPPGDATPVLSKFAEKYGEMFTVNMGGTKCVYVNSHRVMRELLDRRGNIYSSKPHLPYISELMSGGLRMALMEYDSRWRKLRKTLGIFASMTEVKKFLPILQLESTVLLHECLHDSDYHFHNARYANSIIMTVCFGKRTPKGDNLAKLMLEQFLPITAAMRPGSNLPDTMPFLEKLPRSLQWWRSKGEAVFKNTVATYSIPWDNLVRDLENGEKIDCFGSYIYLNRKQLGLSDDEAMFSVLNAVEGGSDTTRATLNVFVSAMAYDPDFLVKVRKELDAVCGDAERLPTFDDIPRLPIITACVKEVLRWRPLVPAGIPRVLIQDDVFEQYYFPKGTQFNWSRRLLGLDSTYYHDDPTRFLPERFMNDDLEKPLEGHWGFGLGRRVCAGYLLATKNLWIAIAKMAYCFDIETTEEARAKKFDPMKTEFMFLHSDTLPFKAKITPRSQKHAKLIEELYRKLGVE